MHTQVKALHPPPSLAIHHTQAQAETLNFDVMMETLRATSLGGLQSGSRVNFERAAKFGDEVRGC